VSRQRRTRRPPGNVHVICTGRGEHDLVPFPPALQIWEDADGRLRIRWNQHQGPGPVTGFSDADGLQTYDKKCRTCGRHFKRREDKVGLIAMTLAQHQGITGDDNTPVILDISRIERA
jgi:hypothetical protein